MSEICIAKIISDLFQSNDASPFPKITTKKRNNKHPKTLLRRTIISIDDRAFSLCHTSSGSSY